MSYAEAWAFPADHAFKVLAAKHDLNRESFKAATPTTPRTPNTVKDLGDGTREVTMSLAGLGRFLQTGQA